MLIEKLGARRAGIEDLTAYGEVVSRLHTLGVLCADLNRYDFVVDDGGRVHFVDFGMRWITRMLRRRRR